MAETRVAPPEIPKPVTRGTKEISDKSRLDAQEKEDRKRKGYGLYGFTREQRLEMGKGWRKAHGELDFKGEEIKTQDIKPSQEKKGFRKIVSKIGGLLYKGPEKKETTHEDMKPAFVSPENIAQTRERDKLIINPPALDDEALAKKVKAENIIESLSEEGKKTSKEYRETWEKLVAPVQNKIDTSIAQNKPAFLEKSDMTLIEIFLLAAQRKLTSDPEVRALVKKVASLPPGSLHPPHIPNIPPRLNQAWVQYDSFNEALKAFRPREEVSTMGYNLDQTKILEKILKEACSLFPSRAVR